MYADADSGNWSDSSTESVMDVVQFRPIIKKTWALIMHRREEFGAKLYELVIYKDIALSRLFLKTNVKAQAEIFIKMMDTVVEYLDHPQTANEKLRALGKVHTERYNIRYSYFKYFRACFIKAIQLYIPWTERRNEAWTAFWDTIIFQMSSASQESKQVIDHSLSNAEVMRRGTLIHESFDLAIRKYPNFSNEFYDDLINDEPDIGELFENVSREVQAAKFLAMLMHAIPLLDDTKTFVDKLTMVGTMHFAYGVKNQHLSAFGQVLIRHVKSRNEKYRSQQMLYQNANETEYDEDSYPSASEDSNVSNNSNSNSNSNSNQREPEMAFLETTVVWSTEHENAWDWFWKIVVNIFSENIRSASSGNLKPNLDFSLINLAVDGESLTLEASDAPSQPTSAPLNSETKQDG
jgi:hemoglobin-like flavoprotein